MPTIRFCRPVRYADWFDLEVTAEELAALEAMSDSDVQQWLEARRMDRAVFDEAGTESEREEGLPDLAVVSQGIEEFFLLYLRKESADDRAQ